MERRHEPLAGLRRAVPAAVLAVLTACAPASTGAPVAIDDAAPASPRPVAPDSERAAGGSPAAVAPDSERPAEGTPSAQPDPETRTVPAPTPHRSEPRPGPGDDPPALRLSPGDSGEPVAALQRRLEELGYGPGPADGVFGQRTEQALRAFQEAHGLPVTGIVSSDTRDALDAAEPLEVLAPGASGPQVAELQRRLDALGYDPGPADGTFGQATTMAVWALQKAHGRAADGRVTAVERALLDDGAAPAPLVPAGAPTRVEIDLSRQLVLVYRGGALELVTHTSTGNHKVFCSGGRCRRAVTPTGDFAITRRVDGWRRSELGRLYNPLYFVGGIAIHGYHSVPAGPASHGCVRVPMHIAEYLPGLLPDGTPVHVRR